jgi:DNA-binding MarR family transcriptional regulator
MRRYARLQKPSFATHAGYVGALQYVHRALSQRWQCESSMNLDLQHTAHDLVSRQIAQNCLLTRTRQISRVLTAIYDEELRPFGIVSPQFTLLVLIQELGPLSRSDLGRRNHHDRSTLTRNLQPLISQEWVSEDLPGDDGRSRPLSLTEQGKALLHSAASAWSAAQAKARALLGEAGANALMGIACELPRRMN